MRPFVFSPSLNFSAPVPECSVEQAEDHPSLLDVHCNMVDNRPEIVGGGLAEIIEILRCISTDCVRDGSEAKKTNFKHEADLGHGSALHFNS